MGGLFLREFVDESIPFTHIDIAGPVWAAKNGVSYNPKGATGFGVRMLLEWLQGLSQVSKMFRKVVQPNVRGKGHG